MDLASEVVEWATAISTNKENNRRIVFRYAKKFRAEFDRSLQPIRIIIVWNYQSETGMPESEQHQRMNELEDALEPVLENDRFATLALVSTGENSREWTYYARSEAEFGARFDFAVAGMAEFPIEIHTAKDPEWSTYEKFIAGVKGEVN
ncbi:DUF695 domain-containing protein [Occallatibacter savannae]|uniref:DUF695 domain-containing protein n=1 Tax=Occallatibacter savannae TaxID=1002691 RepID=UPI000D69FEF4|nr:DUF695 domain-containing protein [Occallatibacter savannae]